MGGFATASVERMRSNGRIQELGVFLILGQCSSRGIVFILLHLQDAFLSRKLGAGPRID